MLEKYGMTCAVMPIGTWRYEQLLPDGSTHRIPVSGCAGTDEVLVDQVKNFRISAGIDLGDVELDVANFIKEASPINNRYPKRPIVHDKTESRRVFRPYLERIKDWLRAVGPKQPRLLIEDDADTRAVICIKCTQNVKWVTGCVPCVEAVKSRAQNVRQRPAYKYDDNLGACRLHDFHIATAIFLDRDYLPARDPEAPVECWL